MPFSVVRPEHDLPAPGICVLCETSRVGREGEEFFVSDVGMIDAPGPFFGRKIVCERCAHELGGLVGMESGVAVEAAREVAEESRKAVADFAQHVASMADSIRAEAENLHVVTPEPVEQRAARKQAEFDAAVREAVEAMREELEAEAEAEAEASIEAFIADFEAGPAEEVPVADAVEVQVEAPEAEAEADAPAEADEAPAEPAEEE